MKSQSKCVMETLCQSLREGKRVTRIEINKLLPFPTNLAKMSIYEQEKETRRWYSLHHRVKQSVREALRVQDGICVKVSDGGLVPVIGRSAVLAHVMEVSFSFLKARRKWLEGALDYTDLTESDYNVIRGMIADIDDQVSVERKAA